MATPRYPWREKSLLPSETLPSRQDACVQSSFLRSLVPSQRVKVIYELVMVISGVPHFTVGGKTVVFCPGNHRDFCPLAGVWQGLLRVMSDPQRGVETVSDNFRVPIVKIQDGKFVKFSGAAVPPQETLSLPTLLEAIQLEQQHSATHS